MPGQTSYQSSSPVRAQPTEHPQEGWEPKNKIKAHTSYLYDTSQQSTLPISSIGLSKDEWISYHIKTTPQVKPAAAPTTLPTLFIEKLKWACQVIPQWMQEGVQSMGYWFGIIKQKKLDKVNSKASTGIIETKKTLEPALPLIIKVEPHESVSQDLYNKDVEKLNNANNYFQILAKSGFLTKSKLINIKNGFINASRKIIEKELILAKGEEQALDLEEPQNLITSDNAVASTVEERTKFAHEMNSLIDKLDEELDEELKKSEVNIDKVMRLINRLVSLLMHRAGAINRSNILDLTKIANEQAKLLANNHTSVLNYLPKAISGAMSFFAGAGGGIFAVAKLIPWEAIPEGANALVSAAEAFGRTADAAGGILGGINSKNQVEFDHRLNESKTLRGVEQDNSAKHRDQRDRSLQRAEEAARQEEELFKALAQI